MRYLRLFAIVLITLNEGCAADDPPQTADSGLAAPLDSAAAAIVSDALRALGTEPFWALDVDTSGLRFITPDDTTGIRFPRVAPTVSADTVLWSGQTEGSAIEVRVWPEKCSDGMSDREYPYAARVIIAGTIYRGCADRRRSIAPASPRA